MEEWLFIILLAVVMVMAVVLSLINSRGRAAAARAAGGPETGPRSANGAPRGPLPPALANYHLAPKNPEVMAAAIFELLSRKLSFQEMLAFADLVHSQELTRRYIETLGSGALASGLAFLCESMVANGFSEQDRLSVSAALRQKTSHEYKLLKIHKNLDKLF